MRRPLSDYVKNATRSDIEGVAVIVLVIAVFCLVVDVILFH
jgi:hypothetical protein